MIVLFVQFVFTKFTLANDTEVLRRVWSAQN